MCLPVAPIKALCSQCFESWRKKFGPLGLNCKELTGDTEIDDFFEIQDSHIILTTPVCDKKIAFQLQFQKNKYIIYLKEKKY